MKSSEKDSRSLRVARSKIIANNNNTNARTTTATTDDNCCDNDDDETSLNHENNFFPGTGAEPTTPQAEDHHLITSSNAWNDDSFSEEHFMSPSSIPGASSWEESHSFDSSSRPSSLSHHQHHHPQHQHHHHPQHQRDHRKNYDTTTPTLVDEEEEDPEDNDGHDDDEDDDEELASALDESREYSLQPQLSTSSSSRLRRTPGASQMHQSSSMMMMMTSSRSTEERGISSGPPSTAPPGLSFDALSVGGGDGGGGVGGDDGGRNQWHSFTSTGDEDRFDTNNNNNNHHNNTEEEEANQYHHRHAPSRPPLAPGSSERGGGAAAGDDTGASMGAASSSLRGPFAFTPWAKQQQQAQQQQAQQATPPSASSDATGTAASGNGSNGTGRAFSPNILRLTEDIGNLLHEDEDDDDYALEIPGVFRGGQQQQQQRQQQQLSRDQQQQQQQQRGVGSSAAMMGGVRGNVTSSGSNNGMGGGQGGLAGSGFGDNNNNNNGADDGGDWTGSYVFDHHSHQQQQQQQQQQLYHKFGSNSQYSSSTSRRGGTVQRPFTLQKDGKGRRRWNQNYTNQYQFNPQQQQQQATGGFAAAHAQQQQQPLHMVAPSSSSFFFPIAAMQPKPRHVSEGNTIFEFGKQQQPPPQLAPETGLGGSGPGIHFGGAFVPPSKDLLHHHQQHQQEAEHRQHQPTQAQQQQQQPSFFLRPVTSPPGSSPFAPPFPHLTPPPTQPSADGTPPTFGMPVTSFGSYLQQHHHQQRGHGAAPGLVHPVPSHPFVVYGTAGDVPPLMVPQLGVQYHPSQHQHHHHQKLQQEQQQQQQHSEMHATAQEFVPRSTRSTTPQFLGADRWQPPSLPMHLGFEPPPSVVEANNWHVDAGSSYHLSPPGYGMPPPGYGDSVGRAAMTPSPHLHQWQPPPPVPPLQSDSSHYGMPPPPATPVELVATPASLVHAPSTPGPGQTPAMTSAPSPDVSQGNRSKKEPRRSTRGRKKKPKATEKAPLASASTSSSVANKKRGKEAARSSSAASNEGATEEVAVSVSENPADLKRAELEESPATRIAFKDFYRSFRLEERHSFQKAEDLAQQVLNDGSLPESIHWRVYLELADLARRSNRYIEARRLYQKVCQLQPFASQGWLEYSKLEEDCGFMNRVSNILHAGLEYCEYSETLLTRTVKHQEKMGNLSSARAVLARLKHVGIDKVWRTVLEGALLEARAGNYDMARRVLKYLMHHVPWYGPLYLEAYKLERDQGHPMDAMQIVERGLTTLPRYGPLWFGAFRLYEEMDVTERQYHLPRTMLMIERAKCTISKELVWKLHLEAAQMLERTALAYVEESGLDLGLYLPPVRRRLVLTILTCPQNLRWKVWLSAGRMELVVGNVETAHSLFQRAHYCVQQKSKSATVLDCARLAEFKGDVELARAILAKARSFYGHDWKVWFESVLVEIRNDNYDRGYELAANGLDIHTGSGRLWATLVQLGQYVQGDEMQVAALERALSAVPKSGEVWCEGARIHLNPFSCTFDLHRSRRYLHFAARFTPQFGDSFIESIRLEVLSQWLYPIAKYIWKKTKRSFNKNLAQYVADVSLAVAVARRKDSEHAENIPETKFRDIVSTLRRKLKADNLRSSIDLTDLRLACTNADPNYGSLWFHCRRLPMYTPRRVIEHAAEDIADEIFKYANIYLTAMIRRMAILATVDQEMPEGAEGVIETSDSAIITWENYIDTKLRGATSLQDILNPVDPSTGLVLLESAIDGSIFITGLSELNRYRPLGSMSLLERRRALFGTDALFP